MDFIMFTRETFPQEMATLLASNRVEFLEACDPFADLRLAMEELDSNHGQETAIATLRGAVWQLGQLSAVELRFHMTRTKEGYYADVTLAS